MNGSDTDIETLSDLSKIHLLGRVRCNFVLRGSRPKEETQELHINAARGFVFDVPMQTGTFSGRSATTGSRLPGIDAQERPLVRAEEVWVKRLAPDGTIDELICPELMLKFRNEVEPTTGEPIADTLTLEHLQAWGARVEIHSPARELNITANEVMYSVDARQIDIRNRNNGVSDKQKYVKLDQGVTSGGDIDAKDSKGSARLVVPHVRMLHTADGELQRIECLGQGILRATRPAAYDANESTAALDDQPTEFGAHWRRSLTLQVAPDWKTQYLTLQGGAKVAELNRRVSLSAMTIAMKLFSEPDSPASAIPIVSADHSKKEELPGAELMASLRPERLTASGNVVAEEAARGLLPAL